MNYRINRTTEIFMYVTAALFDLLSIIPIIGSITSPLGMGTFFMWFKIKGVDYTKNKKIMQRMIVMGIIGFIPIIQWIPETIYSVWFNIKLSRREDERAFKAMNQKQVTSRMAATP